MVKERLAGFGNLPDAHHAFIELFDKEVSCFTSSIRISRS
jgi:hypothetical protein